MPDDDTEWLARFAELQKRREEWAAAIAAVTEILRLDEERMAAARALGGADYEAQIDRARDAYRSGAEERAAAFRRSDEARARWVQAHMAAERAMPAHLREALFEQELTSAKATGKAPSTDTDTRH